MRWSDEATRSTSCWNRAQTDEMVFVLLGRDVAAPVAIEAWIRERIRLGKNYPRDAQIVDALGARERIMREQPVTPCPRCKCGRASSELPAGCQAGDACGTAWAGVGNKADQYGIRPVIYR